MDKSPFNYSPLLVLLIIGLIGSNYYWYQRSKAGQVQPEARQAQVEQTKPVVADFSKKQECAQYRAQIEKDLESHTVGNMSYGGVLLELFYSPSLDTCVSGYESIMLRGSEVASDKFIIKDVLTGQILQRADDQATYKAQLAVYKP